MFDFFRRLFEPYVSDGTQRLYRCDCGDLWWSNSPTEIRRSHVGHRHRMCLNGSPWEMFRLKMGWIK
jgi:hypothetical protein